MAVDETYWVAMRLIWALKRFKHGLQTLRDRMAAEHEALWADGTTVVIVDEEPSNAIDYYLYELGRIGAVQKEMTRLYENEPKVITEKIARSRRAFERKVPGLITKLRNPLTHISTKKPEVDEINFVGDGVIRIDRHGKKLGSVHPLRDKDHNAGLKFADDLIAILGHVQRRHPVPPGYPITSGQPMIAYNWTDWVVEGVEPYES